MSKLFENKIVLVSGGLGDIGRAVSEAFAKHGAAIALCDLCDATDGQKFLQRLKKKYHVPCQYHQVDVSEADAVESWIQETENNLGTPSIIIANAATVTLANIHQITSEQWSRELRVNLDGAFYMAQKATKRLVDKKLPGHVVFVGSWAAHAVHQNMPAYSVSKAGMRMLCKCMALELASHQILVNEIAPGYVQAGLSSKIWEKHHELSEQAIEKVPVKKIMSAETVALQILHLCHPLNEHITGSTLLMDGGLSLLS